MNEEEMRRWKRRIGELQDENETVALERDKAVADCKAALEVWEEKRAEHEKLTLAVQEQRKELGTLRVAQETYQKQVVEAARALGEAEQKYAAASHSADRYRKNHERDRAVLNYVVEAIKVIAEYHGNEGDVLWGVVSAFLKDYPRAKNHIAGHAELHWAAAEKLNAILAEVEGRMAIPASSGAAITHGREILISENAEPTEPAKRVPCSTCGVATKERDDRGRCGDCVADGADPDEESLEPDDRACCRQCGAPVADAEHDDNRGLCEGCVEENQNMEGS